MDTVVKVNVAKFVDLLSSLIQVGDSGATCFQLGEMAECSHYTAQRMMKLFRSKNMVRVVDWTPDSKGRNSTPAYAWGGGEDAPRKPMSREEIYRRYKARKKSGRPPTKYQRNAAMKYLFQ